MKRQDDVTTTTTTPGVKEAEAPALNRRLMFGAGLAGVAAALAAACNEATNTSGGGKNKTVPGAGGGGADAADGGAGGVCRKDGEVLAGVKTEGACREAGGEWDPTATDAGDSGGNDVADADGGGGLGDVGDSDGKFDGYDDGFTEGGAPSNANGTGGPLGGSDSGGANSGGTNVGGTNSGGANSGGVGGGDDGTGGGNLDSGTDQTDPNKPGTASDDCHANTTNNVNTAETPPAPAQYVPRVKFYGRANNSLIAIKFTGNAPINSIVIADASGRLIALHGFTNAVKDPTGAYRPVVIDSVDLTGVAALKIIIQIGSKEYLHNQPVAYERQYKGVNVRDISALTVPAGWTHGQSTPRFEAIDATFKNDTSKSYPSSVPNGNQVRNLHTAQLGTKWKFRPAVDAPSWGWYNGFRGEITDIMGDPILGDLTNTPNQPDVNFPVEHIWVISYYKDAVTGNEYVRTVMKLG